MRILLAAGGTGGHLIPAVRIAESLVRMRDDIEMLFVGSDRGFEERVITARGYRYAGLPARGLSRQQWWRNVSAVYMNLHARRQARLLVREFAPQVAVGCGGYASYFPIRSCRRAGIPYVLQEQNSYPGLVTRWLAKNARKTFIAFAAAEQHIPDAHCLEHAGNPVDPRLASCSREEARRAWDISLDERVVLITGGSSGARSINQNVASGLKSMSPDTPTTLLWQTGSHGIDWDGETSAGWTVRTFAFTDQMTEAMVAADLIVSRSGALTVSEIAAAGKAAILVPYPFAAADHQTHNARSLVDAGGAELVEDARLSDAGLLDQALALLSDPTRIKEMGEANRALARPDAAHHIATEVIALALGGPVGSAREN